MIFVGNKNELFYQIHAEDESEDILCFGKIADNQNGFDFDSLEGYKISKNLRNEKSTLGFPGDYKIEIVYNERKDDKMAKI